MLVWDDKSSLNSSLMGGSGMMMTHDEDTRKFFANTGVRLPHIGGSSNCKQCCTLDIDLHQNSKC